MTSIFAAAANLDFKARYMRRLETALGLGLLLHLAVILAVPPYQIAPYELPGASIIELIDIPDEIDILPLPAEIDRPPLPMEMIIDDLAPPDQTIQPTVGDIFRLAGLGETETRSPSFVAITTDAVLLKAANPVYPPLARAAGAEGRVWVEVLIDVTGRVAEARVIRAEAATSLQEAALRAARQYLFSPARQRDKPVPVRLIIPFSFRLH